MRLTISQRYHFTLFSILADVYPISIQRGQKMEGLNQELDLPFVGDMTHLEEETIEREIAAVLNEPEAKMEPLRVLRKHLETRAEDRRLDARIQSFELAFRMQMEASDAFDISGETKATQEMYGATTHGRQLSTQRSRSEACRGWYIQNLFVWRAIFGCC